MEVFKFGIGELGEGEWVSFRSIPWGSINLDQDSGDYVPVQTTVTIGGLSYSAFKQPLRLPEHGTQHGVFDTSPRSGVEAYKRPGPPQGYTYDPVTQTSTWTIVGGGACAASINQPCIQKVGSYATATQPPSPPPLPPFPPT
mmetsp:Transcript_60745/g.166458  ORF Transcript_60745/g.166458 Transcript_60745/m.166458 type:complete len:142 (+) Transcript_60745:2-427(+)